jgi:L-lysine exporter family protein LysE/ArgO
MLSVLIQGMLLGYGACVPLGPINLLIMSYALRSYPQALVFGFGAMSADITYLALIGMGTYKLLNGTWLLNTLSVLGALFLLYLALNIFKNRHSYATKQEVKNASLLKIFTKGFILTLLNPYTIGFWVSVATLAQQASEELYFFIGLIVALFSWVILMPLVVFKSKHLVSERVMSVFSTVSALILAYFGVMLLVAA